MSRRPLAGIRVRCSEQMLHFDRSPPPFNQNVTHPRLSSFSFSHPSFISLSSPRWRRGHDDEDDALTIMSRWDSKWTRKGLKITRKCLLSHGSCLFFPFGLSSWCHASLRTFVLTFSHQLSWQKSNLSSFFHDLFAWLSSTQWRHTDMSEAVMAFLVRAVELLQRFLSATWTFACCLAHMSNCYFWCLSTMKAQWRPFSLHLVLPRVVYGCRTHR